MANEKQHSGLKELAYSFGMTIGEFSKTIGYTRGTLYQASNGLAKLSKEHIELAAFKLAMLSNSMMKSDIKVAEARHENRQQLIREFVEKFGREDKDGN